MDCKSQILARIHVLVPRLGTLALDGTLINSRLLCVSMATIESQVLVVLGAASVAPLHCLYLVGVQLCGYLLCTHPPLSILCTYCTLSNAESSYHNPRVADMSFLHFLSFSTAIACINLLLTIH
jgi:hypothetical protein